MSKKTKVKVNAYLLKEEYELGDSLITESKMSESEIEIPNSGPGILYTAQANSRPPGWAWFLEPLDKEAIAKLRVASASVVLVLKAGDRYFAVCFGHGYAYIDKRFVEARFGLRTCLNAVDPTTIRVLDKRTFDSLGKLSREQSTRPVAINEFGLEVDKDLLRSIVGKPRDEAFGSQIAGKDSVCVNVPLTTNQLPKFLKRCLKESRKDTYKENFEFIDNIAETTDPALTEELNETLVDHINNGSKSKVWMAVPDIVKWESSAGFKYSKSKKDHCVDDIRLKYFLERWGLEGALSTKHLTRHRVYEIDGDEVTPVNSWSAHHCLYAEVTLADATYILTEGAWYKVNQEFVDSVQTEIDAIPSYTKKLAKWGDEHEQHYNKRVSANSNGYFALMDQKQIYHGGGSSSIEFCDLLSADNEIIHVKSYSGSSVLSHLFHQGTVSAFLTAGDADFRKKVNDKLPDSHKLPEGPFNASDYEVVYAIGTREPMTFELPLFSKVSLRNSVRQLHVSNYKVSLATIRRSKLTKIT